MKLKAEFRFDIKIKNKEKKDEKKRRAVRAAHPWM